MERTVEKLKQANKVTEKRRRVGGRDKLKKGRKDSAARERMKERQEERDEDTAHLVEKTFPDAYLVFSVGLILTVALYVAILIFRSVVIVNC